MKKLAIPGDHIVYRHKADYNSRVENDPKIFSQAINCKKS